MDMVVKTKYAARKIALCIGAMTGEPAPIERQSVKLDVIRNVQKMDAMGAGNRASIKIGGNTRDRISTIALQLLTVICVWPPSGYRYQLSECAFQTTYLGC